MDLERCTALAGLETVHLLVRQNTKSQYSMPVTALAGLAN